MRIVASLAVVAALGSVPSLSHAAPLHAAWEKFKAGRALNHISDDGERALADIVVAQQFVAQGKVDQAVPPLYDAQKRLEAARKAEKRFNAAESALQPAPQHPVAPSHQPVTTPTDWLPVGGEFVASDIMAPEKKAAVASANAQLKAGDSQAAAQTMQVVGEDIDFIVALAPLDQMEGAVNRATVFVEGRQPNQAAEALQQALDGIVFVSQDFVETLAPTAAPSQPAKK
ncbi:YfdX family protein [Gluconacetobacter takamatsuzukensis]|uniref:YfdX family protein n=1 Tax=Gluconacetobacter takamatsuzukensis TaxID=1286190 RepID=A0A7W4KAQ6_9PROT|nr:YfdX family protein [Gluconacetobacter takamatsuzukensis]MBB2203474.1 YfdX family protein [Gluconacetobacter takamatsuzukensis]